MTTSWRSIFLYPFFVGLVTAPIAAVVGLLRRGSAFQWAGLALAALPMLWFFQNMASRKIARFHPFLPAQVGSGLGGAVLSVVGALVLDPSLNAFAVTQSLLVGVIGIPVYTFGYSRLPRAGSEIAAGQPLPAFTLTDVNGRDVHGSELAPAVLMFFRGNWCPLCMAQIQEIAEQYQELERRGVTVALISGQPQPETAKLASQFVVPFLHLVDEDMVVARKLGLFHEQALPAGLASRIGSRSDSAYLPTVVVTDSEGRVLLNARTDNYRVRPEPSTFLAVLDAEDNVAPSDRQTPPLQA